MESEFWQEKPLTELTRAEWESLCDGCGKCCLHKLECIDTGEIACTDVACRFLDTKTAKCDRYEIRRRYVPNCVVLNPVNVGQIKWMPTTCAYRLLTEGKDLFDWHPLKTGDKNSTHTSGNSVVGRMVNEREAGDLEDHIVTWPE